MSTWILALMLLLQPVAPWRASYEGTADAIAAAAQADPLFHSPWKTSLLLLSIAYFESHFQPDAAGDHGASLGAWQIQSATAGEPPAILLEPLFAAPVAIRLIRQSLAICAKRPFAERLAWYAAGGGSCSEKGYAKSRHRMEFADRLLKGHPEPLLTASMAP